MHCSFMVGAAATESQGNEVCAVSLHPFPLKMQGDNLVLQGLCLWLCLFPSIPGPTSATPGGAGQAGFCSAAHICIPPIDAAQAICLQPGFLRPQLLLREELLEFLVLSSSEVWPALPSPTPSGRVKPNTMAWECR